MVKVTETDTVTKRICTLIYEERKARRITQIELSNKLGLSQPHLSKIENGTAMPTIVQWLLFCELFGISSDVAIDDRKFRDHLAATKKEAQKRTWG